VEAANALLSAVSRSEGRMTFLPAEPAHPKINYRHLPIRALHELERFIHEAEDVLGRVRCPVLVMQGTEDPTVDSRSALTILEKLGSEEKSLVWVKADRHGILNENIGNAQEKVMEFVERFAEPLTSAAQNLEGGAA
jgi:esterase/lipase